MAAIHTCVATKEAEPSVWLTLRTSVKAGRVRELSPLALIWVIAFNAFVAVERDADVFEQI